MTDLNKYHQTETVQFHNGWVLQLLKKHTFCYSVLSFSIYCVFSPDTHQHQGCPHNSQLTAVQYISGVCIHHMTPRWRFFHTCTCRVPSYVHTCSAFSTTQVPFTRCGALLDTTFPADCWHVVWRFAMCTSLRDIVCILLDLDCKHGATTLQTNRIVRHLDVPA